MLEVVHTKELGNNRRDNTVRRHIAGWLNTPDPGSKFDKKTKWLRMLLPTALIVRILFAVGYQGLIFLNDDGLVVAHVFFQKHGDTLHVFHWHVEEGERGHGYMKEATSAFFEFAHDNDAIVGVRITAGGSPRIAKFWDSIQNGTVQLPHGLKTGEKMGWLFFPERTCA